MVRYRILVARDQTQKPGYATHAHENDMGRLLGRKGAHWPKEGVPPRMLTAQGQTDDGFPWEVPIAVWVTPRLKTDRFPIKHRCRCKCPGCGKEFSAGRLFQHVCKAGEE